MSLRWASRFRLIVSGAWIQTSGGGVEADADGDVYSWKVGTNPSGTLVNCRLAKSPVLGADGVRDRLLPAFICLPDKHG